jgi:hypothetical protein
VLLGVSERTLFETNPFLSSCPRTRRLPLSIKTHIKNKVSKLDKYNKF